MRNRRHEGTTAVTALEFIILRDACESGHLLASIRSAAIRRLRNLPLVVLLREFFGTNRTPAINDEDVVDSNIREVPDDMVNHMLHSGRVFDL